MLELQSWNKWMYSRRGVGWIAKWKRQWKVLGIGRVGNSENFFSAGGTFVIFSFRITTASAACHHAASCSVPCFSVPRYPEETPALSGGIAEVAVPGRNGKRDSRRYPVGSQLVAVPGRNGKRQDSWLDTGDWITERSDRHPGLVR